MPLNKISNMETNNKRRSIRDIPLSNRNIKQNPKPRNFYTENDSDINLKKKISPVSSRIRREEVADDYGDENNYPQERWTLKNKKYPIIISGIVFVAIVVIPLMSAFATAEVNLVMKSAEIKSKSLSVVLEDDESSLINNSLAYKNIQFDKTSDITVDANKEELVKQKSSGTITVYNMYSENEQNWIKNTRFESPSGLIFRSPVGITIPGYKTVNGEILPGEKTIEIFADDVGEKYNLPAKTNFKVPAFQGQDSYDLFYAISNTNIEGGFDGVRKVVSESDLMMAKEKLEADLKQKLISSIDEQIPDNMIALHDETLFEFSAISQKDANEKTTVLSQSGSLNTIVIDKKDLAKAVAGKNLTDYRHGEDVSIRNIDDIDINLHNDDDRYAVLLEGQVEIVWEIDDVELANELAGKTVKDIRDAVTSNRSVTSVTSNFSFPLSGKFPDNPKRIKINKK